MYQQMQSSQFCNPSHQPMSSVSGIQGQPLEVTVVCCTKLKDTEWISRQDPYVCVEYGTDKSRTRTCTDGGRNPSFHEKFVFTLIEGLREMNVLVWNSNTLKSDDFIGSGKVQLHKVLSQCYDDSTWPLQSKTGRYAGEVRLIMHYKPAVTYAPSAPPYGNHVPHTSLYSIPPPATYGQPGPAYPPAYSHPSYPPAHAYQSSAYAHPHQLTAYPPHLYAQPSAYPPPPYPPPPHTSSYPHPGPFPGLYPPPPY